VPLRRPSGIGSPSAGAAAFPFRPSAWPRTSASSQAGASAGMPYLERDLVHAVRAALDTTRTA
jgi:hypothetical protein